MDEYAAFFQSRIFAAGELSGRFPAPLLDWLIPRGFQDYFLNVSRTSGAVSETYWPGFALLLAPFTWAGVPWLCNPVITALTLLVIHRISMDMFQEREAAGFAMVLTIASPVVFANGISYYSMPAHLLTNSLFVLLLMQPTPLRSAAAGIVGSLALTLHNPVPHLLFAAPWVIWLVFRRDRLSLVTSLVAGYLPLCIVLGAGWFLFSGNLIDGGLPSPTTLVSASHRFQNMLKIFSLPDTRVALARLIGLAKIWVWSVPGLAVLAVAGIVIRRRELKCSLLAASALVTLVGYWFVPVDQGHGWGYRYFHAAWMTLPLLATAALFSLPPLVREEVLPSRPSLGVETRRLLATCALLSLVFGVSFRGCQIKQFVASNLNQLPQYHGEEKRIVIVDARNSFYGADLVQNDPWLRGNEVRMYSRGSVANEQMMADFYPQFHRVYEDWHGSVWSQK
jgi:hypothetical protein